MNKHLRTFVALSLCAGVLLGSSVAYGAVKQRTSASNKHQAGIEAAKTLSMVTGVAISPLLGVGGIGVYQWWNAPKEKRHALPWFAQPWFWVPALALVAIVGLKDIFGTAAPTALKKPFDVAETVENKISALIAAGAFIPLIISIFPEAAGDESFLQQASVFAAIDGGALGNALIVPFAIAAFAVVWLAFHAVNVLIVLSPFTILDTILKLSRLAVLGIFTLAAMASPYVGAILSVLLILACYLLAGWSFRLMIFGTVYVWDFVTLRSRRFQPGVEYNLAFTARPLQGAPVRSYGKLFPAAKGLKFVYRPWLFLPRRELLLPEQRWVVGRGLFYPEISGLQQEALLPQFVLPPRYQTHEEAVGKVYGITEVRDVGLLKNLKSAWAWLKSAFGVPGVRPSLSTPLPSPVT